MHSLHCQVARRSIHSRFSHRAASGASFFNTSTSSSSTDATADSTAVRVDRWTTPFPTTTTTTTPTININNINNIDNNNINSNTRRKVPQDGKTLGDFVASSQHKTRNNSTGSIQQEPMSSSSSLSSVHAPSHYLFHIKTYGCQMNVNDTDIVRAILVEHGYREAHTEDEATIWLTNTCAIREKAEQKVWQRLQTQKNNIAKNHNHNNHKKKKKQQQQQQQPSQVVVGVLGCMAERLQEKLLQENVADLVVGPDAYRDLPRMLKELLVQPPPQLQDFDNDNDNDGSDDDTPIVPWAMNVQLNLEETYSDIVPIRSTTTTYNQNSETSQAQHHSAFVSIQRGCSNRCSFCIVPFTRGQERSRPLESILAEVTQLLEQDNLKEVVLLGQNVNSYHDRSEAALTAKPLATLPGLSNSGFRNRIQRPTQGGFTFVDLVEQIADLNPELRVRFTSPHPKDYPDELLHCMAERSNVCNQLHLPAQSGSTSMLKRMKRGYSRDAYLQLIDNVQTIIPDVALSSDFIAGFCEETEQEHRDTVTLLEQVEYEQAFLFAYSMREKTHAHRALQDNVPASIKQARLQELIDTFRIKVHAKNERVEIGKLRLVLVEGPSKRQVPVASSDPQQQQQQQQQQTMTWHGRTDQNKRILFPVQQHLSLENTAWVLDESVANHQAMAAKVSTLASSSTEFPSSNDTHTTPSAALSPLSSMTTLNAGEYAVVEVTEAKGHTLRGRVLWKTTLANFARFEPERLSTLHPEQLLGFKQQLIL